MKITEARRTKILLLLNQVNQVRKMKFQLILSLITVVTAQSFNDVNEKILIDVVENQDFDLNVAFEAFVQRFEKTYDSESDIQDAFSAFTSSVSVYER